MSGKYCFVFCHGFGFDATFWDPLRPYFAEMNTMYLDLGYFGHKKEACHERLRVEEPIDFIGIGHSLGFSKLIQLNIPFKRLIGLHGFIDFLGSNTLLHRRRQRELMSLIQQFSAAPESTLRAFYQRTGVAFDIPIARTLNRARLLDDLSSLAQSVPVPNNTPMLILGSNDDKIVPPNLIEDNFGEYSSVMINILNQAQHGLGYFKPDVVYQYIMRFLGS